MKKFAIAAIAAVVATVSLSSVAEAGRRPNDHFRPHGKLVVLKPQKIIVVKPQKIVIFQPKRCTTTTIIKTGFGGRKTTTFIKHCR